MRRAIRLHRPADQQQNDDDAEDELFLPGQTIHVRNIVERSLSHNDRFQGSAWNCVAAGFFRQATTMFTSFLGTTTIFFTVLPSTNGLIFSERIAAASISDCCMSAG